MANVLRCVTRG